MQNLISQYLNEPHILITDGDLGFLTLVAMSAEAAAKSREPVPCDPGDIIDVIANVEGNKKYKGRNLLVEYTEYTKPWRVPGKPLAYPIEFFQTAQQWLTDNGIDFTVWRTPSLPTPQPVNVHLDSSLRPVKGECKYMVTYGDIWLYRRMHGELPNGKPDEVYNLEALIAAGVLPAPSEGKPHKTGVIGVQCARLYLSAIRNLTAGRVQDPTRFRAHL